VHRGTSIGILNDEELMENADYQLDLLKLFEAIAGTNESFTGKISIFNEQIRQVSPKIKKKLFILPQAFDTKITNLKIRSALQYNIDMDEIVLERKKIFDETLKSAGINQKFDGLIESYYKKSPLPLLRNKKQIISDTLEATGLILKDKKKFNDLTPLEFLLFSIAYALAQDAIIIMFSIPLGILDKLDYEKFNNYMEKIKRDFHIILIFHGPEEIISNCDKILTITEKATKIGTFKEYIEELPQVGEIITVELNNPNPSQISQLKLLDEIDVIIEERREEKYRIFLKQNTENVIIKIAKLLGPSLFSFKRGIASIKDYLEFTEQKAI
jgi:ABC-type multidrug transport system ATPase subunit